MSGMRSQAATLTEPDQVVDSGELHCKNNKEYELQLNTNLSLLYFNIILNVKI